MKVFLASFTVQSIKEAYGNIDKVAGLLNPLLAGFPKAPGLR